MAVKRLAYFDCFSGASGDMIVGALVGAGAPLRAVEAAVRGLGLRGVRVRARPVRRAGFAAVKFDVLVRSGGREVEGGQHHGAEGRRSRGAGGGRGGGSGHRHDHDHDHDHDYDHDHDHDYDHDYDGGRGHRHVAAGEVLSRIRRARLAAGVKERAVEIFERLARAEAKAHGTVPGRVHFHEVGAVDSIVDVVGAAAALDALGLDEIHCSPLPAARGHIHGAHGVIPAPGPATVELMRGIPVVPSEVEGELVTPTGAAVLAATARRFGPCPAMTLRACGTGAGAREIPGRPNILRVLVGEAVAPGASDTVWILETNLDDAPGTVVGHALDRLFRAGALDAWTTPIQMKKSRPGILLSALCPPDAREAVEAVFFRETPTFGVRRRLVERTTLERRTVVVRTRYGAVGVKVGADGRGRVTASPEYEDCRAAAERHGVALREVMAAALRAHAAQRG